MLNKQLHEKYLKTIYQSILENHVLNDQLALKGGTCLYFFYDLPRFSVDLDFNLVSENLDAKQLSEILEHFLEIEDHYEKHFTWFWLGSYEKGQRKIKIEINKRKYPDEYEVKSFYGASAKTLAPADLFAHKLCAITDRKELANRDLYDAWFMFEKRFEIDEKIIELRTGKSYMKYLEDLITLVRDMDKINILEGLGELLDEKQKQWAKEHLANDLLFQLRLHRDLHSKK